MSLFSRNVELYDFQRGATHWTYCDRGGAVTVAGLNYQYAPIKRGSIAEGSDASHNTLELTVPQDLTLLDLFRGQAPAEPVQVALRRQRISDGGLATLWTGEVGGVTFSSSTATIQCLPPLASLRALGLRRNWQKQCPHVLYGAEPGGCNASRSAVQVSATITQVTGNVVRAAAFAAQPNGWWTGGYIEWPVSNGAGVARRFIADHSGDAVTLLTQAAPLGVGAVVTALPGCDHTLATCSSKFANAVNYGGQPWIPLKNPFGSSPIY